MNKVNALLAVKANTRLVLATELVARNTEIEALRLDLSIAKLSHLAAVLHIPKETTRLHAMAAHQAVLL